MRDLLLSPVTNDLDLSGGQLKLTEGVQRPRQRLYLRLSLNLGDWFLNRRKGVPIFRSILGKTDRRVVELIYRRAITTCPLVKSLDRFVLVRAPDRTARLDFDGTASDGTPVSLEAFELGVL